MLQCSRDRIQILPLARGALSWPPAAHSSSPFCTCPCDLLQPSCLLPGPHRPKLSPNHRLLPLRGHCALLPLLLSYCPPPAPATPELANSSAHLQITAQGSSSGEPPLNLQTRQSLTSNVQPPVRLPTSIVFVSTCPMCTSLPDAHRERAGHGFCPIMGAQHGAWHRESC